MPREKGNAAFIYDILQAAADIERFVRSRSEADFNSDEMLASAVERKVEIVGKAARLITEESRLAHPEIPWKKIITTPNIVAHDYDTVNRSTLLQSAVIHMPDLVRLLSPLLPAIPPDPRPET
jgi:uncharacterized protein with HEPN domain